MVLVDIGNTNYHIYKNGKITHISEPEKFDEEVFYISVNKEKEKKFKKINKSAVNLKDYVRFETSYKGLGIDRIMACKSVNNGVVVDAGSAVTIDVMKKGVHIGGAITPGLYAFKKAFGTISEVLKYEYGDFLPKIPENTNDALICGSLGAVVCLIEKFADGEKIYCCGGDGRYLSKFLKNAQYVEDLVFLGMLKTIKEMEKK